MRFVRILRASKHCYNIDKLIIYVLVILFYVFYHRFYGIGPHTEDKACSE